MATDLRCWKYKNRFVKVNSSISCQGELHVKVNPSISAAHLWSNILAPLPKKTIAPEHTMSVSFTYNLVCTHSNFIYLQLCKRAVRTACYETTHELLGLDTDPDELSPEFLCCCSCHLHERRFQHRTKFAKKKLSKPMESADGTSRYAPNSF